MIKNKYEWLHSKDDAITLSEKKVAIEQPIRYIKVSKYVTSQTTHYILQKKCDIEFYRKDFFYEIIKSNLNGIENKKQ